MTEYTRVLMIAAENDTLPGAKVGGVGDVIRDLPGALNTQNLIVDCVIPSYGFLDRLAGNELLGEVIVAHSQSIKHVKIYKQVQENAAAEHYIFHHKDFSPQGETVYCNDDDRPFATDATKFALFNIAVAQALLEGILPFPNYLHCHDWHAAFILILREFAPKYRSLQKVKTVFSIHNIAMQGVRPLAEDESSLDQWYPDLKYDEDLVRDPIYKDCINPLRSAILLADKIHTVSPTYAQEILSPSDFSRGIYGGEGLENDLRKRHDSGDLVGVLNGCEYPSRKYTKPARKKLTDSIFPALEKWSGKYRFLPTAIWLAEKRLNTWLSRKTIGLTITSIGRLTEQKVRILNTRTSNGERVLDKLSKMLGDEGTIFILGSGDSNFEDFMSDVMAANENLIFLNGYSNTISDLLYKFGDVFLMPSSFEPCGISQLLAMRAGQPCIVNGVGGLKDTINHEDTGFVFSGNNLVEQADNLIQVFQQVLDLYHEDPAKLKQMAIRCSAARFTWENAAKQYVQKLYI